MYVWSKIDSEFDFPSRPRVDCTSTFRDEVIPVIAPVASGDAGASYNVNADTMAGAIAGAYVCSNSKFERICF